MKVILTKEPEKPIKRSFQEALKNPGLYKVLHRGVFTENYILIFNPAHDQISGGLFISSSGFSCTLDINDWGKSNTFELVADSKDITLKLDY